MSSKKKQPKVKQIAAGRTLLNHNHFNQKTYINVINHAQNYNVELDYQYKQHTLTHSIMQPETVNGNAIRACDFKIRSRNKLWPFLNLPSHRSIRAASKPLRTHPGSTSRGVPPPTPHWPGACPRRHRTDVAPATNQTKTLSDTAQCSQSPPNFKSTWACPNWNPKWARPPDDLLKIESSNLKEI